MMDFKTISYSKRRNEITILDQTRLPGTEIYVILKTVEDVRRAIRTMQVRGAPLLGVTAAYGMVLAAGNAASFIEVEKAGGLLLSSRPTAVNLAWAVSRMLRTARKRHCQYETLLKEARLIEKEDQEACARIGLHGMVLLKNGGKVMVHCNAGALATSGIGTALGIIYTAKKSGKKIKVYACETRPLLQGARLTSWELTRNGIETCVICDNMAATVMPGMDLVLVGADRVARNGDTANKIGTYGLAIIARYAGIPFYIAAPLSSFDFALDSGKQIPIEHRDANELKYFNRQRIVAKDADVYDPAFDITPGKLVTGFITEKGISRRPPYRQRNHE